MMVGGYMVFLWLGGLIVPGHTVRGVVLKDKTQLRYKINGLNLLIVLLALLGVGIRTGRMKATVLADHWGDIFVTTNIFVLVVTVLLLVCGKLSKSKEESFRPRSHGNLLLDWWMGVQLNPHFLGINLKFFWLRPSMMAWLLVNLSVLAKQWELYGAVSAPMVLYQVFTGIYVVDYFLFERFMLSTWDITDEGFGFMLCWGDLVFIPFTFSVQAWCLLHSRHELPAWACAAIVCLFIVGFATFRGANMQKHCFKENPAAPFLGIPTRTVGGKDKRQLLVSGFWGLSRKSNYLGDILLAFSYCLPCGLPTTPRMLVAYLYPTYLTLLLLHRGHRDEQKCRRKYGAVWEEYCRAVPYKIFPYIY